ncbi:uncharacterized protein [Ptychodera flava]|uniref:uncharacterized protein n=1 Tax=Ptychodera flava TaxID=63121 RepID=UPI00396A2636
MSDTERREGDHSAAEALVQLGTQEPTQAPNQDMLTLERERRAHDLRIREMEEKQQKQNQEFQKQNQEFQLKLLQLQTELANAKKSEYKGPKVPKFEEGEDIDAYLRTFEKLAKVHEWPESTWATRLLDFWWEKHLMHRWLEAVDVNSFDKLKDLMLVEQLLEMSPPYLQVWLREKKPKNSEELVDMADHYVETHKKSERSNGRPPDVKKQPSQANDKADSKQGKPRSILTCYSCHKPGHKANKCPNKKVTEERQKAYRCRVQQLVPSGCRDMARNRGNRHRYPGKVNSQHACILRDTGCDQTIVHSALVPPDTYVDDQYVNIEFADGSSRLLPLAVIYIQCQCYEGQILAAVLDTLPEDVLLGNDIEDTDDSSWCKPAFFVTRRQAQLKQQQLQEELIDIHRTGVQPKPVHIDDVVPLSNRQCTADDESVDIAVEQMNDISGVEHVVPEDNREAHTTTGETEEPRETESMTRDTESLTEVCDEQQLSSDADSGGPTQEVVDEDFPCEEEVIDVFDIGPTKLRELQKSCSTLSRLRKLAVAASQVASEDICFYWGDGFLYRKWTSKVKPGRTLNQLVVPRQCRATLLRLAHDIPLAGHLGVEKTKTRLLQHYYWPGIFPDVAKYCRTCEACQKAATRKAGIKAKLIPMPVLEEPFQRIAMDMIGPLPVTSRGNRFVLTICDYATRYPEAIPVPTLEAKRIAEELVTVFSRVGIPREILSDQGTNFLSHLMEDLCKLLHIKKLKTSPYHPMANGLVENFNGTLKSMLKKFAATSPESWDRYIPYLSFAYREVPQQSTGFSPFELLYGRQVRGPLAIMRESWTGELPSEENLAQFVVETRDRLAQMTDLATDNLSTAQKKQKVWYDRTAREREFQIGDQVLILLPSSTNKLQAQWQGPYKVTKRISTVDYEVEIGNKRKKKKVYHVNMLRKWFSREGTAFLVRKTDEDYDESVPVEMDICHVMSSEETWKDVEIYSGLKDVQRAEATALLEEFGDLFTDCPGRTPLIEHSITTTTEQPVRLRPYRLPESLKETVKVELSKMLKAGIIQKSHSPYAAPIILVKKKDLSWRFCVDYRGLNKVTEFDPFPMPRTDEMIEKLGKANYITSIDLTKGYWQIPLDRDARAKSAFITPYGQYEFLVMPFGMQNAPATFMRLMQMVLDGCQEFASSYFDDVDTADQTWNEHIEHLRQLFVRIRDAELTIRPSTCKVGIPVVQ